MADSDSQLCFVGVFVFLIWKLIPNPMLSPNPPVGEFETNDTIAQGEHTAGQGGAGGGILGRTNSGSRAGLFVEICMWKASRRPGLERGVGEIIAVLESGDLFIYQGEQWVGLEKYEHEIPKVG